MYELLLKGGEVIDPAQGIHDRRDIAISNGKIAALGRDIAASEAKRVIDVQDKLVTPGLVDLHAHIAEAIMRIAVAPDEGGVQSGVTTICDGGSTGYANFLGFKKFVVPQAQTDVFCFLNLCSTGLSVIPEIWGWHNVDPEATAKTVEENRDLIRGIKLRAIGTLAESLGVEAVKMAKSIAVEARLPLMVHIGKDVVETTSADIMDTFTRELLPLLDKGDILNHVFTWKAGGVIKPDGSGLPELREAIERGVVMDVAEGASNFSLEVARKGLAKGILPNTLSTDLSMVNRVPQVGTIGPILTLLMSKFVNLGLSLDQVIQMTTINPARALGEEQYRGSLTVGMQADVSILRLSEGDFLFSDGAAGGTLKGKLLLEPELTLKAGREISTNQGVEQK